MRIVVVQPPARDPALEIPLPIGVVRGAGARFVAVKVTFTYAGHGSPLVARPALDPEPIALAEASRDPGALPRELYQASDFVPEKPRSDVMIVGHAYAARRAPRIDAGISAAGVSRRFTLVADKPAGRIALSAAHLHPSDAAEGPLGPLLPADLDEDDEDDEDDRGEPSPLQWATRAQQGAPIRSDEVIELVGLSAEEESLEIALPGVAPRVFAEDGELPGPVALRADTLWIDTDRERIVVVWRGSLRRGARRIIASLEQDEDPRSLDELRRDLARAAIRHAIEEDDLRGVAPAALPEELVMARYDAWGSEAAAASIPLDAYAQISAELAEKREDRSDVLARRDLDEASWAIEERAWLEAMASGAMAGDGTVAVLYGELFMAAQDRLAAPEEGARTLADYAAIRAATERASDPSTVLAQRSTSMSAWMRLDRRWTSAAAADPAVQADLDRLLAAEHAATGPVADDEDDDEGEEA